MRLRHDQNRCAQWSLSSVNIVWPRFSYPISMPTPRFPLHFMEKRECTMNQASWNMYWITL